MMIGSLGTNVHILHDKVSSAVVDESGAHVCIVEQRSKLLEQLLLSITLKNDCLALLDNRKALIEYLSSVLLTHERLELWELARRNIDHLILAYITRNTAVLSLVVKSGTLCT